jgi:hypothetical protein
MNEIASALRVMNTAVKTVRIIEIIKKATVLSAAITCCVFVFKFFRK